MILFATDGHVVKSNEKENASKFGSIFYNGPWICPLPYKHLAMQYDLLKRALVLE